MASATCRLASIGPWHRLIEYCQPVVMVPEKNCMYIIYIYIYIYIRLSVPGWCSKSHRGSRIFLVQQTMSFILWVSHKGSHQHAKLHKVIRRILCMLYFYPRLSTFQTLDTCNHNDKNIPSDRNMPNKFASRSCS